jgi:hypothetical protein
MLSWKYTKPYQYSIVFKSNKIYINDQGKKSSVDAKSKTFEKINKLIVGSSNGTMFNDPEFTVTYFKNGNYNVAKFIPKTSQLLKYIKQIELISQRINLRFSGEYDGSFRRYYEYCFQKYKDQCFNSCVRIYFIA